MADSNLSPSPEARSRELLEHIVKLTMKGQIRSKVQVLKLLQSDIEPGEGEVFEQVLMAEVAAVKTILESETDELKQAKATRRQRALTTLQSEFEHWQ
jgi:hypothetical protein